MAKPGIEKARDWLAVHAPFWTLRRATTTLEAGVTLGAPTQQRVEVELIDYSEAVILTGSGPTMLEAVQRAIGALDPK